MAAVAAGVVAAAVDETVGAVVVDAAGDLGEAVVGFVAVTGYVEVHRAPATGPLIVHPPTARTPAMAARPLRFMLSPPGCAQGRPAASSLQTVAMH